MNNSKKENDDIEIIGLFLAIIRTAARKMNFYNQS